MAISDKNSNDLFRESNLSTPVDKGCSESNNIKKILIPHWNYLAFPFPILD